MLAADLGGPLTKHPQSLRKEVRTVKRWTILLAGAALWLFLAAIPALADGGPHVMADNSGSSTLTADSCAGCHRAHTAQGAMLLKSSEEDLCLTCHGSSGVGASTDVEIGVQFKVALATGSTGQDPTTGSAVLGALRGGGFVEARIDSDSAYRVAYNRYQSGVPSVSFRAKVPVRTTGQAVTSAHLNLTANGLTAPQVAWGNGALNSGAGPTVEMGCATCHNPHGNGNYRILRPIPSLTATVGTFTDATAGVTVTDADNTTGTARNYTVIQTKGGTGTLLASQVLALSGYTSTMGDYLHRSVPWDPQVSYTAEPAAGITATDAPNGLASTFNGQINSWCATCHSRYTTSLNSYASGTGPYNVASGDGIFKYRHSTTSNKPCLTCHVSHGSNAQMPGDFSKAFPYPNSTDLVPNVSPSSRLLKIDNRGTCQACHDPTTTITPGTVSPSAAPSPAPYVP
jgi:predicted CXXCH cytochrome family protein